MTHIDAGGYRRVFYGRRWGNLLGSFVGPRTSAKLLTVTELDQKMIGADGGPRGQTFRVSIYRQLAGKLPHADRICLMARGIRAARFSWMCVLIALFVCGYFRDYVGVLGNLSRAHVIAYAPLIRKINALLIETELDEGEMLLRALSRLSPTQQIRTEEDGWTDTSTLSTLYDLFEIAWASWYATEQVRAEHLALDVGIVPLAMPEYTEGLGARYTCELIETWVSETIRYQELNLGE